MKTQTVTKRLDVVRNEPDLAWGEFLVECPNCRQCAHIETRTPSAQEKYRLLSCSSCGLAQRYHTNSTIESSSEKENCFETLFWLNTNCAGHKLWAANENHLVALENEISSQSRELPEWMLMGKNREEVSRGLTLLRTKLQAV